MRVEAGFSQGRRFLYKPYGGGGEGWREAGGMESDGGREEGSEKRYAFL